MVEEKDFEPGAVAWLDPDKLRGVAPRQRVYGYLYVTEYDNYGDVQWETAIESAKCTKKGVIGGDHMRVATSTHYVELLSTYPCRVAFCADGEDLSQAELHAFPLPADTPVQRLVPMNTAMTIVTFPGY